MDNRYPSVDRRTEIKLRKNNNQKNSYGSVIFETENFDINKFLTQRRNNSIKSNESEILYPKKLPSISKKRINPQLIDIISKSTNITNISTERNNAFSFEKDNKEKHNSNYFNTDSNIDKIPQYYSKVITSSYLTERTNSNINTGLSSKTNILKPIIVSPTPLRKIPNERLYPRNSSDNKKTNNDYLKVIKEIKNKNSNLKNHIIRGIYKKIPADLNKVAFDIKYEDVVFDANKIIHEFKMIEKKKKIKNK